MYLYNRPLLIKLLAEITRNAQLNTKKTKHQLSKNSINQIMDARHGCRTRNSISFISTNERLININTNLITALKRPSCLPEGVFFMLELCYLYFINRFHSFLFNTDFLITGKLQQGRQPLKRNDLHLPTSSWRPWIRLKELFMRPRPADPDTLTIHIVWKRLKPISS